jgi:hypothetical protein
MFARLLVGIALTLSQLAHAHAAPPALPDELVLEGDNIIEVLLNGVPIRLEVSAEAFGPPVINPDIAERLLLLSDFRRGWRYGPVTVYGVGSTQMMDFGREPVAMSVPMPMPVPITVTWADRTASTKADGVIGVHHLPYARVTFALAPPRDNEQVQRFALKRAGGSSNARIGTGVKVGKRELMMIFVTERADNLITAPTANFIATHQEGGFAPESNGIAVMDFAVERPTRIMRIAHPIELGDLLVDRFAVRVEDYGDPKRVGEIGENDPRFEAGRILVSRRKGKGKPDLLTRIGRDQIAHCSQLTYDLALSEIRLSCGEVVQ